MADEKDVRLAKETFATLCKMLDGHDWHYSRDDENYTIKCGAQGEDLPMDINIKVDPDKKLVMLLSFLPFNIPEEKRLDMALAVSIVNNRLVDGSFDYDVRRGALLFRMTTSFIESTLSETAFEYMLYCSCGTIDDYNDKFLMLCKGLMPIEKFFQN